MPYNPFLVQYRIHKCCYVKLTSVGSLNAVSCIIIRATVSFAMYSFQIWQIKKSDFNKTCYNHSKWSLFRIKHALTVHYVGTVIWSLLYLQCKFVGWEIWLNVHHRGRWVPSKKILCRDHFLPTGFMTPEGICLISLAVPCGLDSPSHSIPQASLPSNLPVLPPLLLPSE